MLFTEPSFLFLFLPALLALYFLPWRAGAAEIRNWVLVIASVVFYATGGGAFTFLILGSIVFNYLMAIAVDARHGTRAGRVLLAVAVGADLAVLAALKYADFIVSNVNVLATPLGLHAMPLPRVLLPIGISFFTFHAISYVVDVYRRDAVAQKSPVEAALYLLLFPQLIAGPIIRYREIAAQLGRRVVTADHFAGGATRFVVGLAKKVLVANVVAVVADAVFAMPLDRLTAAHAWLGVTCYTLQIYFDFSGYSDMAIGLGAMFGFRFPENFNYPYVAVSVQDFWRRWHMSLSRWFRDYLYVPLGGNRVSPARTYVNLVTVFFLCGLWHGASWTFVAWGLYHGAFLVLERVFGRQRRTRVEPPEPRTQPRTTEPPNPRTPAIRHVYTIAVVMVGWVFFRADTFTQAMGMLRAMAGLAHPAQAAIDARWYLQPLTVLAIVAGIVGSGPWIAREARRLADGRPAAGALRPIGIAVLFAASLMFIAANSYNPFIYFRF
ncbi:MAG TPA: MBOAT family protein [Vicinamibacterales bacterium]|nr:MBOAT family protein [Vicinamibacterales bacterium]